MLEYMMICIYFSGTILYFFSFYSYFNGKNIEKYFRYLFLNFRDHFFFDRGDSKSSGLRNHFVSIILQNSDVEGIAWYIPRFSEISRDQKIPGLLQNTYRRIITSHFCITSPTFVLVIKKILKKRCIIIKEIPEKNTYLH